MRMGVPVELRHLPEYKELLELKRMKKHKLQEIRLRAMESGMRPFTMDTSLYKTESPRARPPSGTGLSP
ncbi:hypothetical protein J4Q44_G00265790 [Coregonus suidteri]|uniref:Uncharacterized protein n=1 Tax=Coregonus suidteri TaxID=861788 RepID=A0AAN8QEB7_9TELE